MAQSLMSAGRDEWVHAQSEHFIGHGMTEKAVNRALRKAEEAYVKTGELLRLKPVHKKVHVFVIDDKGGWHALLRAHELRNDARAFQYRNELYIEKEAALDDTFRDDVLHEVVHYRLAAGYRDKLPLAIEEGLARFVGWQITQGYYAFHGTYIERTRPRLKTERLYGLNELFQMDRYPENREAVRVFYRQSEAFIHAVTECIGEDNLGDFIRQMSLSRQNWEDVLCRYHGCSEADILQLKERVKELACATEPG
jgi:hypothetical protein